MHGVVCEVGLRPEANEERRHGERTSHGRKVQRRSVLGVLLPGIRFGVDKELHTRRVASMGGDGESRQPVSGHMVVLGGVEKKAADHRPRCSVIWVSGGDDKRGVSLEVHEIDVEIVKVHQLTQQLDHGGSAPTACDVQWSSALCVYGGEVGAKRRERLDDVVSAPVCGEMQRCAAGVVHHVGRAGILIHKLKHRVQVAGESSSVNRSQSKLMLPSIRSPR
mmetsp:Transcript_52964/g.123780  ORF Transcript_52964/g.123780 Transcript_52964/m.123780 type:complete len:221 (+) Transcript_52964:1422-2084(+)